MLKIIKQTGQIKRIVAAILVRDKMVMNELGENSENEHLNSISSLLNSLQILNA